MDGTRLSLVLAAALALALAAPAPAIADDPGAMVDAAARAYEVATKRMENGVGTGEAVHTWSVRWLDAQRDLPLKGRALAAAATAHLERMKQLSERTRIGVETGTVTATDLVSTTYFVLEAERWVKRKGKR